MIAIASEYGRYGYRSVTNLLRMEGWRVGKDAVYTIWRHHPRSVPDAAKEFLTDSSEKVQMRRPCV